MNPSHNSGDTLEYDLEKGTYRASYEEPPENPIVAIVEAIATLEETDPHTLEPLGGAVEMEALNAVLHHSNSAQAVTVRFSYRNYRVTIQSNGVLQVLPADSEQANP